MRRFEVHKKIRRDSSICFSRFSYANKTTVLPMARTTVSDPGCRNRRPTTHAPCVTTAGRSTTGSRTTECHATLISGRPLWLLLYANALLSSAKIGFSPGARISHNRMTNRKNKEEQHRQMVHGGRRGSGSDVRRGMSRPNGVDCSRIQQRQPTATNSSNTDRYVQAKLQPGGRDARGLLAFVLGVGVRACRVR